MPGCHGRSREVSMRHTEQGLRYFSPWRMTCDSRSAKTDRRLLHRRHGGRRGRRPVLHGKCRGDGRGACAVDAAQRAPGAPLPARKWGKRPEPDVPGGWVRVKVSHASLTRHDLFTLRGMSGHPEGITYPIILGNDAAGVLDDGTPVVIYPLMGSADWRGDETLDPQWHIPSEFIHGTFAGRGNVLRLIART